MDLNKFFSALERHEEYPDDYYIGYYGFTVAGVREKLSDIENEDIALTYLNNLLNSIDQINKELKPYCFSSFYEFGQFDFLDITFRDENKKEEKEENEESPYSKAQRDYREFLTKLDFNTINNPVVRIIVEDAKTGRDNTDIHSLRYEFDEFSNWLKKLINKVFIIKATSSTTSEKVEISITNSSSISKLASFHSDLPADLEIINNYIDGLIDSNVKKPKSKIVSKIIDLYEDKYQKIEMFNEKSFFLTLIYDHINHRQPDWTKEKFINYANNR